MTYLTFVASVSHRRKENSMRLTEQIAGVAANANAQITSKQSESFHMGDFSKHLEDLGQQTGFLETHRLSN
jgi:hypothetical protein